MEGGWVRRLVDERPLGDRFLITVAQKMAKRILPRRRGSNRKLGCGGYAYMLLLPSLYPRSIGGRERERERERRCGSPFPWWVRNPPQHPSHDVNPGRCLVLLFGSSSSLFRRRTDDEGWRVNESDVGSHPLSTTLGSDRNVSERSGWMEEEGERERDRER
ncbi:hypothetical protein IE53DRAFT_12225 [Violaceomyces palustris]|uniref:Uncharacterized protein n=1 Tax=Violaceomyces palustris TaxID=1673888 RepID=A0ACD0NLM8_9BASI|nr:hypothetical protein IE53DRAFT_12225 [Violaceomyces palustris]